MFKITKTQLAQLAAALVGVAILVMPSESYANNFTNAILSTLTGDFIQGSLIAIISHILLFFAGWWVSITAGLLDISITATLNMADLVQNTPGIGLMWRAIRDLTNIALIGVMLYASIRTILGLTGNDLSNIIKNVIICGLFINFSLFATRVMIDGSNLVALTFYDAIKPYEGFSISDTIMAKVKVQSFFSVAGFGQGIVDSVTGNSSFTAKALVTGMGAVTVMTMIGFLFLGAAITMVYRLVVLLLCMAFSPIYFIAIILPQTKSIRTELEGHFYKQLFSGPIFLMVLYVGLKLVDSISFGDNAEFGKMFASNGILGSTVASAANFATGGPGTIVAFFNYAMVIIVLVSALAAAQKSGGYGGELANKWFEGFSKWGQGKLKAGMRGVNSAMYNQTLRRGASVAAESRWANEFSQKYPALGRIGLGAIRNVAKPYEEGVKKSAESKVAFAESLGYDKERVKKLTAERDAIQNSENYALLQNNFTDTRTEYKRAYESQKEAEKRHKEAVEKADALKNSTDANKKREAANILAARAADLETKRTASDQAKEAAKKAKEAFEKEEERVDNLDADIKNVKIARQTKVAEVHDTTFLRSVAKGGKDIPVIGKFISKFDSAEAKAAKELGKKQATLDLERQKEVVKDLKKELDDLEKAKKDGKGFTDEEILKKVRESYLAAKTKQSELEAKLL